MATDTRERILDATAELFLQRGFAGTGLKAISTAAAAPFGSLYHHFPGGKDELAAASLRRAADGYAARVGAVVADGPTDLVEAMRHAFDAAATTLVDTDFADACPIATVALEVASTNEPLREVTAEIFDGWLTILDLLFLGAGLDQPTARRLSTLFLAALEGGFLLCRAAKDAEPMRTIGESVAVAVAAALADAAD
jgi:AcrR family transcriptional regulator